MIVQMLDATKCGDGLYLDIPFSAEEVASAVFSLSKNMDNAIRLVDGGALPLILEILGERCVRIIYPQ